MKKSKLFLILLIVIILAMIPILLLMMKFGIIGNNGEDLPANGTVAVSNGEKIDDWIYKPEEYAEESFKGSITTNNSFVTQDSAVAESASGNLGFSTGGAKDINNFRENIEEGYFPLESDITYEGIFYDYSFDTGNIEEQAEKNTEDMFYPTYSTAISKDPISNEDEYYMSVGLNSNIKESDFERKKLNIVLVLDISGSMDSPIDNYYYDFDDENEENKSKMQLARESISILIDELNPEDSLGIVLFDNSAYEAKPLNIVGQTDMEAIKEHVLEIEAMGGTNFEAGYRKATRLFEEYGIKDTNEYENRIIVITDAMPNYGTTSDEGLLNYVEDNSKDGIYTTFIGVGVDFNTELIKQITNVEGSNYYSVSSEEEFKTRMGEEFEYMVTPLVFDLNLDFESEAFEIESIYGTDDIDSENGNIMHVNTLFPSKTNEDGEVKGGIILLKLKKLEDATNSEISLKVSYKERSGEEKSNINTFEFSCSEEFYDNTGIRKGIVLSRYVNTIRDWISYERTEDDRFLISIECGIIDWYNVEIEDDYSTENERISVDLTVSDEYKEVFKVLKEYMENEIEQIDDDTMSKEVEILEQLI